MIDPHELRKGNLVYTINRQGNAHIPEAIAFQIVTIGLFEAEILLPELNPANIAGLPKIRYADLSPIYLTEDILVKCGFKQVGNDRIYFAGSQFYFIDYNAFDEFCLYINLANPVVIFKLKTVHQLQNLYFALIGDELKITLK